MLQPLAPPLPKSSGVDPAYLQVIRDGLYQATHDPLGTSSSTFAHFAIPVAGKTGTAEKVVTLPGYPPQVLNQSLWCGWGPYDQPDDRRLRRDRERRPRRHGGGAGGGAGAGEVLQRPAPTTGKVRGLMVQYIGTAATARRRRRRPSSVGRAEDSPLLATARLDAAAGLGARSSPTASGRSAASPGTSSRATRTTTCRGSSSSSPSALLAMIAAIAIDPEWYRRSMRGVYVLMLGVARGRAPRRERLAALAALDRRLVLPLPAVRVREAPARPLPRGVPRRPAAHGSRTCARR